MYLGIDLGTSSIKTIVIDGAGKKISESSQPIKTSSPRAMWSEQNPLDWLEATEKTILSIPKKIRTEIKGIGLSGQMHGAVLLDNQDRALKKSNGEWTYFANDAAYHLDKCKRNFYRLVNIWRSDHIGYIPRMNSLIKAIKDDETYLNILTCQIVSLIQNKQKIKMSKRSGNFVTLANVHSKVGKDPIRYYMISTKNETAIDFDLDAVVEKNKDNKVFYCQYAHARASSVINKANELGIKIKNDYNFSAIENLSDEEVKLIKKLICYPYLLYQSSYYNEPHRLINYLEEISSDFHSIWNKGKDNESLRFIDEKNAEKTISKIFWLESFRVVLKDIFSIIDISAPETM